MPVLTCILILCQICDTACLYVHCRVWWSSLCNTGFKCGHILKLFHYWHSVTRYILLEKIRTIFWMFFPSSVKRRDCMSQSHKIWVMEHHFTILHDYEIYCCISVFTRVCWLCLKFIGKQREVLEHNLQLQHCS